MAYITTEQVANIRKAIKAEFPRYKFSITRKDRMAVHVALMQADFEVEEEFVRIHNIERHTEPIKSIFERILELIFQEAKYYDNSDTMTDYVDVPYYYDLSIGTWEKPYICKI